MARKAPHRKSAPRRSSGRVHDAATPNPPHADRPSDLSPSEPSETFPIVGIGASAGGLEAFSQLLRELPTDVGMAFVLVQHLDPKHEKSAKHPGMPQSARAIADFVLPPAGIAREVARIGRHPYLDHAVPSPAGPSQPEEGADVSAVLRVLRTATGVDFAQYKPASVRRRIARRMLLQKIDDLGTYVRHLRQTPHEAQALHDDILIQVTEFFRDPEGFETLKRSVFPSLVKERAADEPIRIWVPGCATGEEAYSIVICLLEFLGEQDNTLPIQMFATDLSAAAVTQARAGRFPASIDNEVSADRLRRFFVKTDGRYQISKAIRDACVFAQQDVTRDPPFSKLDLISCCNVLIYLSAPLQERVIAILHYALKPTGFLRFGPSESVGRFTNLFSVVDKKHKIYARKPAPSAHLGFGVTAGERIAAPTGAGTRTLHEGAAGWSAAAIENEADRLVLGRYAPAGGVVNADMEIRQFRGKTGPSPEAAPGTASFSLFKMAREGLLAALRQAVQRAARSGRSVTAEGVRVKADGGVRKISLEVIPLGPADHRHHLILFFEERHEPAGPLPPKQARERAPR